MRLWINFVIRNAARTRAPNGNLPVIHQDSQVNNCVACSLNEIEKQGIKLSVQEMGERLIGVVLSLMVLNTNGTPQRPLLVGQPTQVSDKMIQGRSDSKQHEQYKIRQCSKLMTLTGITRPCLFLPKTIIDNSSLQERPHLRHPGGRLQSTIPHLIG